MKLMLSHFVDLRSSSLDALLRIRGFVLRIPRLGSLVYPLIERRCPLRYLFTNTTSRNVEGEGRSQ